jgi:mannose-1-phosphate guanylyltransferase
MRYGYMKAMNNEELIQGVVTNEYWVDAGTPKRYFDANLDVLSGRARVRYAGNLPPERESQIWVAPSAEIAASAKLQAPLMVGAGVRIADGAQIGPNTVLAAGSSVGRAVVVENSVVLDDARADDQAVGVIVGKKARVDVVKDA